MTKNRKIPLQNDAPPIPIFKDGKVVIVDNHVATKSERKEYYDKVELRERQLNTICRSSENDRNRGQLDALLGNPAELCASDDYIRGYSEV